MQEGDKTKIAFVFTEPVSLLSRDVQHVQLKLKILEEYKQYILSVGHLSFKALAVSSSKSILELLHSAPLQYFKKCLVKYGSGIQRSAKS